jgi:hypothetical protein
MSKRVVSRNRAALAVAGALLASCSVGPDFHRPAPPSNEAYYTPEKETAPDTGPAAAVPLQPAAATQPTATGQSAAVAPTQAQSSAKASSAASTQAQSSTNSPSTAPTSVPPSALAPEASAPLPKQALQVGADLPAQWWQLFKSPALDQALKLSLANSPTLAQATATLAQAREEVRVAQAAFLPRLNANAGVQRNGNSEPGPQSQSTVYTMGLSASYAVDVFGGTRRAVEQQRALAEMQG